MKLKQFLAAALMLCSAGAWAQTDVTSDYITNADFSQTTPLDNGLCGYGKDMGGKGTTYYGLQAIDGWTSTVLSGDNSNNSYPNSGMGGAVFAYGSDYLMMGNNTKAPSADPNGNAGNCLGFFGVWGCGGYYYQEVTLAAGEYTINIPVYNQSGTQANTSYIGWIPNSGTSYTLATNPTVGSWTTLSASFTLTDATTGKICLGYKSTGNGSAANAMLYFDKVQILYKAVVVKDVLSTAITAATNANATLNSSDLTSAIATAQAVYDDADATQEEVNAAAATLNAVVEAAMATADNINVTDLFLVNADLSSTEGWTAYASGASGTNYQDYSNGLIGTYNVRFSAATVDETHLATEYCFGFECRWSTNYASYNQTTDPVPAGVYTLTFDVENVNGSTTSASYNNLFYIQAGSNKVTDTATEWMQGGSSWTTHTIRITVEEATPLTVSFGYGTGNNNIGSANTPALYVSHVNLSYSGFLVGAKAAWEEAVAAAEIAKTENPSVTGDELTALNTELAKAEPTTADGYNQATEDIYDAIDALVAAKPSYDAYAEAAGIATTLDATAVTAPTTAAEAVTRAKELYVNIDTKVTSDYTFDATEIYGGDFTGSFSSTTTGQHWSDDASKSYLDNWGSGNISATQDITLPAGSYVLKVAGRGAADAVAHKLYVSANGTTVNIPNNGDTGKGIDTSGAVNYGDGTFANDNNGRGWEWRFIPVTLTEETTVTVTLTMERSGGNTWGSFCDFTILMSAGNLADSDDYAALNTAISTAEAKTLGFQNGEYAPYNNVDALTILAEAKAIDQEIDNPKNVVTEITSALNAATWTANTADVDAIYNGTFAEIGTGSNPKGWSRSNNGWGQQITGLTAEANGVNEGTTTAWYYNTNGAWEYGKEGVYTMPLAENQTYLLTFKYSKHGSDWQSWMKASVVNDSNEGLEMAQFTGADNGTNYVTAKAYFTTGAAGDYILSIEQNGNAHLTDVSLVKAESAELALNEGTTYEPVDRTYYETVTMTRKVVAGYNTVCLPFDLTADQVASVFGDDAKVYEYEDVPDGENSTINFNTKADNTIAANVPVLISDATAVAVTDTKTINGVILKSGVAKVAGTNFDFVGTYAPIEAIEAGDYFIGNGALYKSAGATSMKAFRAYIHDKTNGQSGVKLYIDDIETAISEINGIEAEQGVIYNIAGQRVNKAQKGIYIVNGKKVLVK